MSAQAAIVAPADLAALPVLQAQVEKSEKAVVSSTPSSIHEKGASDVESLDDGLRHGFIRDKEGNKLAISWTEAEERAVVRKADTYLLPIFTMLFFWMHLDRTNIAGILTSTFARDTGMTQLQINTGTSLIWLGVVLLEIPSNVVLQRVGPHLWIPLQVILWGLAEVLSYKVHNASSWYAARLFLGLLESGFIPGSLYTLSRWYTKDELAKRTVAFFFGTSLAGAFGSLIAAGCIHIHGRHGLAGWQWIFIIDGAATIAAGVIAFLLIPAGPRETAGGIRGKGWFNEREADIYSARIAKDDDLKTADRATLKIKWADIVGVLSDWRLYPHLVMCLSGLQSVGGLGIWGGTIIKSLGFSAIRANLLSVPGPLIAMFTSLTLAYFVDKYKRYGYAIFFTAIWTVAGLIALYKLPIRSTGSWGFYVGLVVTQAAPNWQAINVTWVSLNARTPARRAITYAVYIGCSNLGGTYGAHVFAGKDAPLYRTAWTACLALGAVWAFFTLLSTSQYYLTNKSKATKWANLSEEEQEAYTRDTVDTNGRRLDFKYQY